MERNPATILLIEDNPTDRILLKKLLSMTIFRNWEVIERTNLVESLENSKDSPPAIALLDLSLPDSSGIESFKHLKLNNADLPIIVLTGMSDLSLAHELIKQGAQDYLIKGDFDAKLLEKSIDYALERHRLKVENNKTKEKLLDSVLEAQDIERARIAKELHDGVVQSLTAVSLNLAILRDSFSNSDKKSLSHYEKCVENLSKTIDETRNISHALMPRAIAEMGLINSVEALISDVSQSTEINFDFLAHMQADISEKMKITLYRIIQELVNNTIKHSQAKNVMIQLLEYPDYISLMVEDDGMGFDKQDVLQNKNCFGLHSLESRVSSIGGTIEIDSRLEKGTNISISLSKQ